MQIVVTEHPLSIEMCQAIHEGTGWPLVPPGPNLPKIATYGILRGTGECIKEAEEFWYVDHGYFRHGNGGPHYRVVHNSLWHPHVDASRDWDRFNQLGIRLKKWNQGKYVIVVPPTIHMERFWNLNGWLDRTISHLKNFTDRPIYIHRKTTKEPLKNVLQDAWCLVTDHSNAAVDALIAGVPAIITHPDRKLGDLYNRST